MFLRENKEKRVSLHEAALERGHLFAFLALGPRPQDGRKQESAAAASQESIRLLVSFKRSLTKRPDDGFLMKRNVCFHGCRRESSRLSFPF